MKSNEMKKNRTKTIMDSHEVYIEELKRAVTHEDYSMAYLLEMQKTTKKLARFADYYKVYTNEINRRKKQM